MNTVNKTISNGVHQSNTESSSNTNSAPLKIRLRCKWVKEKQVDTISKSIPQLELNCVDKKGRTPLVVALKKKNVQQARELLAQGADVNISSVSGAIALHYAAKITDAALFSTILEQTKDKGKLSNRGHSSLYYAVKKNNIEYIKKILQFGVNLFEYAKKNRLLHEYAFRKGFTEAGNLLVTAQRNREYAQFEEAIKNNSLQQLQKLITLNKDVNVRNSDGNAPLHQAVISGNKESIQLLLSSGAHINIRNAVGKTALHIACENRLHEVVQLLLESGADPYIEDDEGWTALHSASSVELNGVNIYLLSVNFKDLLNKQDLDGTSPLYVATMNRHLENVENLLLQGASCDIQDVYGDTALHRAVVDDDVDIVKELIRQGCDQKIKNQDGDSALMTACRAGSDSEIIFELSSKIEFINYTNERDGQSPLMIAFNYDNFDAVKFLLEKGADFNHRDFNGDTILHRVACSNKAQNSAIARLLLDIGADCYALNHKNITPIGYAIEYGNLVFIKELLNGKYNKDVLCYDGLDAVTIAKECSQKDILKELIDAGFQDYQKSGRNFVFHKDYSEKLWRSFISAMLGISIQTDKHLYFVEEGSYSSLMYTTTAYALEHISPKIQPSFFDIRELITSLLEGLDGTNCFEKLQMIAKGNPIIISTGWEQHDLSAVIYDKYLFICNRGEISSRYLSPILTIHRIDPAKITPNDLEMLYNSKNLYTLETGAEFIYKTLPEKWRPDISSNNDQFIQYVQKLTTFVKYQKHQNCSKASLFLGIFVHMICYHYRATKTMDETNTEIRNLYKLVTNNIKIFYATAYLSRKPENSEELTSEVELFRSLVKAKLNALTSVK